MDIVSNLTFTKIKQIGEGQNSTVWLVHDPQLACELAVKEIDKTTFWNPNYFAEAQAVESVAHPNIVKVKYGCECGNSAFIAMPFYPNGSLSDKLSKDPLGLSSALSMAQGLLAGLEHIHVTGYVHLDIKPSNVFFDNLHRPLIADFGQSRKISAGGIVDVPPMYYKSMPPEVLLSGKAAYVSDIYQVGMLLYRSLNGEVDFATQVARFPTDSLFETAIKRGKIPNRKVFLPHVPKRVRTAIRKALNIDPGNRFTSAIEFAKQLGRIRIENDWNTHIDSSGEIEWRCFPDGKASIIVKLARDKASWRTSVHTENEAGIRRAKGEAQLWGKFASRELALEALNDVFESL